MHYVTTSPNPQEPRLTSIGVSALVNHNRAQALLAKWDRLIAEDTEAAAYAGLAFVNLLAPADYDLLISAIDSRKSWIPVQ